MVVTIFARYTLWHYSQAPRLMFGVWRNLMWYLGHIFSVDMLWRSLFKPWRRIVSHPTKRWDFEDIASSLLANFISRIIGGIMRLALILVGRAMQLVWLIVGVTFYLCWFVLPALIVFTFLYGLTLFV